MEAILKDLEQLAGVEHGCIYHRGDIKGSTFPSLLNANLAAMGRMLEQIFGGIGSIGRNHNEIYIELDENYLVGYRTEKNFIIFLLTGKNINFSLIHISVRSAANEMSLQETEAEASSSPDSRTRAPAASGNLESLRPMLSGIQEALTQRLGPVAQIVFDERLAEWQRANDATAANLGKLIRMLSEEIPDMEERLSFAKEADRQTR